MELVELVRWFAFGCLAVLFSYLMVRSMAWAWFRTKLEHFRAMRKERGDDSNAL